MGVKLKQLWKVWNCKMWTVSAPDLTIVPSFVFRLITFKVQPPCPPMFNVDVNGSYFEDYVRCSYVFHLTGLQSKGAVISGNPRRDVYSYFGPKVCPTAISHLKLFWVLRMLDVRITLKLCNITLRECNAINTISFQKNDIYCYDMYTIIFLFILTKFIKKDFTLYLQELYDSQPKNH